MSLILLNMFTFKSESPHDYIIPGISLNHLRLHEEFEQDANQFFVSSFHRCTDILNVICI